MDDNIKVSLSGGRSQSESRRTENMLIPGAQCSRAAICKVVNQSECQEIAPRMVYCYGGA